MLKIVKFKALLASCNAFSEGMTFLLLLKDKLFQYKFVPEKYAPSFISLKSVQVEALRPAPQVIYTFWTGKNEMSEARKNGVKTLTIKSGVEVKVITPDNLDEYILKDHPLHKSFNYLSLVHKSDYLRCYFMLHYGGGYSDVKPCKKSWKEAFKTLNESNNYVLGYREILGGVPTMVDKNSLISKDVKKFYFKTLGICSFIFKPNSPIAIEWMEELNHRLDLLYDKLKENPGNVWGDNKGYPVIWCYILSEILHPIFLKYNEYLLFDNDIKPELKNYR